MKTKTPDFRVCPACEARNKAKWEFCVRCGESMQNVPLGMPAAPLSNLDEEAPVVAPSAGIGGFIYAVVGLGALAAALWFAMRPPVEPDRVDPGTFVMPTLPPTQAEASVAPPGESARLYAVGRDRLAAKDYAAAVSSLGQAVALDGERADYRSAYGRALWGAGSLDEARSQFQEAARLNPSAANINELARLLEASGRGRDAADTYERVLDSDRDNVEALKGLAGLHLRAGRHAAAIPILRRAREVHRNDLVVAQDLGAALDKNDDLPGAEAAYRDAVRISPESAIARGQLAEVLFKQGKVDEAVQVFREGLDKPGDAPLLHRGLGSLLERTGKMEEAAAEYRAYARMAPNAPDAKVIADRAEAIAQQAPAASASPAPQS